jgi:hypothetical protein
MASEHNGSASPPPSASGPGAPDSPATDGPFNTPTPSTPPTPTAGPLTAQLPAGVRAVTVTFVEPGSGATIVYSKAITDPLTMQRIISDVDGLHVAGNETQGCVPLSVDLQMKFTTPTSDATFNEDSQCARATLTVAGKEGPMLGSELLFEVEKLLGVSVTTGPDGQPSVG